MAGRRMKFLAAGEVMCSQCRCCGGPCLSSSFRKSALNLHGIRVKEAEEVLSHQFCG